MTQKKRHPAPAGQLRDSVAWLSAAQNGDLAHLASRARDRGLLEARTPMGATATMLCARHGHADCLELLIQSGADIEACSVPGWTPAFCAVNTGQEACLSLPIARGCDLEKRIDDGTTLLMLACREGRAAAARLLVEAVCDIDAQSRHGYTAAMDCSDLSCLRLLIDAGCSVALANRDGQTAEAHAAKRGWTACEAMLRAHREKSELRCEIGPGPAGRDTPCGSRP